MEVQFWPRGLMRVNPILEHSAGVHQRPKTVTGVGICDFLDSTVVQGSPRFSTLLAAVWLYRVLDCGYGSPESS